MKGSLRTLAVLTLATIPAHAVLVSSGNLGTFALGGSSNIVGDTATGANNADWYPGVVNPLDWGNELVYEFSTSETLLAQVTSNALTGDPDFFLLSNLNTTPDGALNLADGALGATFLDGVLGATESLFIITAGTYFLSIDSFGVGTSSSFDIDLSFAAAPPAPVASFDLGILGDDATSLTLDTLTSNYDTELAIFDAVGNLISDNDDVGGGPLQSEIVGSLSAGNYYAAIGGWDTTWSVGFGAAAGDDAGDWVLNHPNGSETGAAGANEVVWFSFGIVPEPATIVLFALSGLSLLRRRRA